MLNFENIYEDNRGKLVVAEKYEFGNTYITECGTRIKFLGNEDDTMRFKIINSSPLELGEKVSEYENETFLKAFWAWLDKM